MKYYLHCLKNYTNFSGRARRSEYWFFTLFHFLFMIAIIFFSNFFAEFFADYDSTPFESLPVVVYLIYVAAVFIPTLAVTARRLHDIGKSGTWVFIYFVPLIGGLWLLVLLFTDSQPGLNKWGYNPKEEANDEISQIGNYLTP
jgi:uncharacterized membrane protein YhaH (DUF805 family)